MACGVFQKLDKLTISATATVTVATGQCLTGNVAVPPPDVERIATVPGGGTCTVGFCARDWSATIIGNTDWFNGWVQVTNGPAFFGSRRCETTMAACRGPGARRAGFESRRACVLV